jgi:hypothetical protein
MEKIFPSKQTPKQAGVAKLIFDKMDFKPNLIKRDKQHFMLINGVILLEKIVIITIYAPNIDTPNFIK